MTCISETWEMDSDIETAWSRLLGMKSPTLDYFKCHMPGVVMLRVQRHIATSTSTTLPQMYT